MRCPPRPTTAASTNRVNLTPMIDVVFLLIIFFLVSSHLARRENRHPVDLTKASMATLPDHEDASVVITIDSDSNLRVGGDVVSLEQCVARLRQRVEMRGDDEQAESVRVRIDSAVTYRFVKPLLNELASMGVSDVAVAVLPASHRKSSTP